MIGNIPQTHQHHPPNLKYKLDFFIQIIFYIDLKK